MAEHTILHRTIAVKDFWGPGKHIYEDQLGWTVDEKKEAGSLASKKIFTSVRDKIAISCM